MKKLLFIIPFVLAYVGAYIADGMHGLGVTMVISSLILSAIIAIGEM